MGGAEITSYKPSRRVVKYDLNTGAGNQTINVNLPGFDLSRAQKLALQLYLTTILTDVEDTLDVRLQDTRNGVVWNTRVHFPQVLGNTGGVSATTPYVSRMALYNNTVITTAEQSYIESGSVGGADIPAGTAIDGPFLGVRRDPGLGTGGAGMTNTWRLQFVVAGDANANASFIGALTIWAE